MNTLTLRRSLRRMDTEDVLSLIIGLGTLWLGYRTLVEKSIWNNYVSLQLTRICFGVLAISAFIGWIYRGTVFRVWLERRWPLPWRVARRALGFVTHSIPEFIFEVLSSDISRTLPQRVSYPLTLTYPAGLRDKMDATRIAKDLWGESTPNMFAKIEWHLKNPNTLAIVRDARNVAVGYFDFMPVDDAFVVALESGVLNELDLVDSIEPGDTTGAGIRSAKTLYVAGIAAAHLRSWADETRIGAFLVYSLSKVICAATFSGDAESSTRIVAAAFDGDEGQGKKLLGKLGFTQQGFVRVEGDHSEKLHPWYSKEYSYGEACRAPRRLRYPLSKKSDRLKVSDLSTATTQIYRMDLKPNDLG